MNKNVITLAVGFFLSAVLHAAPAPPLAVDHLRCEGRENPEGLSETQPGLSWQIKSEKPGQRQTAYRIVVDGVWDSGKVASDQSAGVAYAGKELQSRQRCSWKVMIWDKDGRPSPWSEPATWTMGLLKPEDWTAKWITASRWFVTPQSRPPGFMTSDQSNADSPAWAQVDLGTSARIDSVRLYPHKNAAFPLRFRIEADDDVEFNHPKVIADCTSQDFQIGDRKVVEFPGHDVAASRVRLLILKSPPVIGQPATDKSGKPVPPKYRSVVRQMEVWSGGRNVALMRPTIESGHHYRWGHAYHMVDGMPSVEEGDTCPEDACRIETAPLLRKSFTLDKPVQRAVLYHAAHGMADVTINGTAVDDTVHGPRFTDYAKRIVYLTHDVTKLLASGQNVIGAVLGNGFFSAPNRGVSERYFGHGPPRLLAQLEIEFADGTRQTILSDNSWKWARSGIVFNDFWRGYNEDRRQDQPGWDRPGFADASWKTVGVTESLGGRLCAPVGPPVRRAGLLKPVRVEGNTAIFDVFSSGWPRIVVNSGKAGQRIVVGGDRMPSYSFTLAKDGPAVLEPRFVWGSGALRMTVNGLNEPVTPENVAFQEVHADLALTGSFHCSNPWLNTLHEAVLRTQLNYCHQFPADPMREKQGWTQDAQNMFNTAAYLTDANRYYGSWWRDMADNQLPNGLLGSVVPIIGQIFDDWNCPWWSGVIVWLPWEHYLYYGDRRILEEAYEPMRRYVDYLDHIASLGAGTRNLDHPDPHYFLNADAGSQRMLVWNGAGDWGGRFVGGDVPGPLMNMTGWYRFADIVSRTAALLGKQEDAGKYAAMAREIGERTNAKFLNRTTGLYGNRTDSQPAQVMPLAVGMVPDEIRALTFQRLLDAIRARDDHHGCGFVSLPYLLQLLTESGQSALANRIMNQESYPSWKTLMHDGVFFEDWHGTNAQMPSAGGSIGLWLYQSVLGIRPDPAGPGFKKFILAPQPDAATGLTEAEGWYDSVYGRIVSKWRVVDGVMTLNATIPANTTATIILPGQQPQQAGSGKHQFITKLP